MKFNYTEQRHKELSEKFRIAESDSLTDTITKLDTDEKLFHSISAKELESDSEKNTKKYVITDSSVDRMDEIVDPNGLDVSAFEKSKKTVFWNHDYNRPIGRSLWQKQEGEKWIAKVEFASDTTDFARDIRNLAFGGFIGMTSIGFIPKSLEITSLEDLKDLTPPNRENYDKRKKVWVWRKSEMVEWSIVGIGSNRNSLEYEKMLAKDFIKSSEVRSYVEAELFRQEIEKMISDTGDKLKRMEEKIGNNNTLTEIKGEIENLKNKFAGKVSRGGRLSTSDKVRMINRALAGAFSELTGRKIKI